LHHNVTGFTQVNYGMKYLFIALLSLCVCACVSESSTKAIQYQPFSTSVIEVHFANAPRDTFYMEAITHNNIPNEGQKSEEVPVTKEGSYFLKLTNDRPTSAFLLLNGERHNIIIFPDDTVHINIKVDENGIEPGFSGKGADINEYYKSKKSMLGYVDTRIPLNRYLTSSSTYESIKHTTDSLVTNELNFLKKYITKKELPQWFIQHEEAEIKYLGLGFKTQMPKYNEVFNLFQDDLSDQYYAFLEDVHIDNPTAISSSQYFGFLDDYFIKDLPNDSVKKLSGFYRINKIHNHILPQSKNQLSGEVKESYHSYLFSSIVRYISDTSAIDSLVRVYEVNNDKKLLTIAGTRSKAQLARVNLNKGDKVPNFYAVDVNDSLVSLRDFQDKTLYVNFWATWCAPCIKNMPELNEMIRSYKDEDEIMFLNVCLDSKKEKWLASVDRYHLEGTNLFAEGKWNEKLRAIFNMQGIPNYALIARKNVLFENHTNKAPAVKSVIDRLLTKK